MNYQFDVIIERPHDDANEYAYDETARALRLENIVRVDAPTFADHGVIAGTAASRGESLRAFLISDVPISPHARVAARAVGALEYTCGEMIDRVIVAVPLADSRYARACSFNDLPALHRAALQRLLEESARWLDANSAEELIHLARKRARLAQLAQREQERTRPAWEVGSDFKLIDKLARETGLHTQAEATLFTLPFRFQQYIRLCLTPSERILFWVHRPRFTVNRIARIGSKTWREGLLLITDQQLLWMVDPVTPSIAVEGYGYIARSVAVELLVATTVHQNKEYIVLQIASVNALAERDAFQVEFPLAARDELAEVERLLCAFAPRPNDCRLRRVAVPRAANIQLDDPMESDREKTAMVVESLQQAVATQLNGGMICAQAFVPTWADGGTKLLTVTDRSIYLTPQRTNSQKQNHAAYSVQSVIAPEICFSVLGSWFRIIFPHAQVFELAFPSNYLQSLQHLLARPPPTCNPCPLAA